MYDLSIKSFIISIKNAIFALINDISYHLNNYFIVNYGN